MSKANIEHIKRTHKLDEKLIDSGAFIDRNRLRSMLVIACQERALLLAEVERLRRYADELEHDLALSSWPDEADAAMREALERMQDAAQSPENRGRKTQKQMCQFLDSLLLIVIKPALTSDVGLALLERLRRAEGERDEAREAFEALARAGEAAGNVAREER